jgi:hypothetical protein
MKKIKLTERDIMRIVKKTIKESQKTKKKKTITVSESDLIKSIEQIVNEQNAVLGFGNQSGIGMGIAIPSEKYKDLQEDDEEEVDEQAKETENIVGGKETVSVVDDPAATADGMGMFEEVKALKEKINRLEKTLKRESQLRTLKTIKESRRRLKEQEGKGCSESEGGSGCIKKRGGKWVILNNKKGGIFRECDSKKHCEEILDGFHASKG